MERRIEQIERTIEQSSSSTSRASVHLQPSTAPNTVGNTTVATSASHVTQDASSVALNLTCSLGAFPASSITSTAIIEASERSDSRPDLISCECISVDEAEQCLTYYKLQMDSCIHYVLAPDVTLAALRLRSSLLTAAICTVASFCTGSSQHQSCFKAFKNEVSRKMFDDRYHFDDVRALCIGAFWLSTMSAALNGLGESQS